MSREAWEEEGCSLQVEGVNMEVSAVRLSLDVKVDEKSDEEGHVYIDDQSEDGEDEDTTSNVNVLKENNNSAMRRYAAIFHNGKLPLAKRSNFLLSPAPKDEGHRDRKKMQWEKYFGQNAREDFYGRSSWVKDKRNFMNLADNVAEKVVLNPKEDNYATDYAFAPRRIDKKNRTEMGSCDDTRSVITETTLQTTCTEIDRGVPTSPRTRYIGNCINNKINPRASLILRKNVSTKLTLKHQVRTKFSC